MKFFNYLSTFFLLLLMVLGGVLLLIQYRHKPLISPVQGSSKLKIADNIWFPKTEQLGKSFTGTPEITAKSAIFVDLNTGEVLYDKNSGEHLPIASLTKIMTVIIALENRSPEDVFQVSERAANMEPDKMLLIAGEKLSLQELLDGIFLVSANDAAEVLAENTTGRREEFIFDEKKNQANRAEFINLMNSKAKQIGMNNTIFVNPTGLEEDNQTYYSTALDILLMSRYAISKWPRLLQISSNPHIFLPKTVTHQDYDLYTGINLINSYPGVLGFKTGFTAEAGLTLVTVASRQDEIVIGVLLGSTNRRDDAKELLDYSFRRLGK